MVLDAFAPNEEEWDVVLSEDTSGSGSTFGPSSVYQDWITSSAEQFNYSYASDTTLAGSTTSGTASGGGNAYFHYLWINMPGGGEGDTAGYSYSGGWSGTGASLTTSGGDTATVAMLDSAGNPYDPIEFSQSTPGFATAYSGQTAAPTGFGPHAQRQGPGFGFNGNNVLIRFRAPFVTPAKCNAD